MQSKYTLRPMGAGWLALRWPADTRHTYPVDRAFELAAEIPGVRRYPNAVQIPLTAVQTPEVRKVLEVLNLDAAAPTGGSIPQWRPEKRPLFLHQHQAVAWALKAKRGLLADDMGLGKTSSAIAFAESVRRFYDESRPVVILARKALRGTWLRELVTVGAIEQEDDVCVLESRDHDDESFRPTARWFFVNPEIVRHWWSRILSVRPCCTVIDEAHYYKDLRTSRGKGALMVSTAPYLLLLTGTPMPNKPADLWSLMTLVNGKGSWGDPTTFRKRYAGAEFTGHGWRDTTPTNTEELRTRMAPWYLRREIDDIGVQMPKLSRTIVESSWEDARLGLTVKRKHKALVQTTSPAKIIRAIKEGKFTDDVLTVLSQLRSQTSQAKVDATVEHVESLHGDCGTEPVVVFTWAKSSANLIAERCTRFAAPVFLCTGDTDQRMRDRGVVEFQRDGGVLVATYGVFAEGVTLTRARFVVHHDLGYLPSEIAQAERRIHRIGQDRPCVATWMVLRDSIDEIFARVLEVKLRAMSAMLDITDTDFEALAAAVNKQPSVDAELEASLAAWRGYK